MKWLTDLFKPEELNNLNLDAISAALNDPLVRDIWLNECFAEIQRINLDVDKWLMSGSEKGLIDLCARRRAYQDVMESILGARRKVTKQGIPHNPPVRVDVNLDRVTA